MTNSELVSQTLQEFRGDDNYGEFRVSQDEANALLEYIEAKDAEIARLKADALRMRWLLAGNGYFMEHEMLCGHDPCDEAEQDEARRRIDDAMAESAPPPA